MSYKIIVEKFGKIDKAEIEVAPLTFFIGDNNSGKSYLLSLIWALRRKNNDDNALFQNLDELDDNDSYKNLKNKLKAFIESDFTDNQSVTFNLHDSLALFNIILEKNKNAFISDIFNDNSVKIGKLIIKNDGDNVHYTLTKTANGKGVKYIIKEGEEERYLYALSQTDTTTEYFINILMTWVLSHVLGILRSAPVYMPSARTGFMLSKDVINKFARQNTYDTIKRQDIQPFTKPILNFLDNIESLRPDYINKDFDSIIKWTESSLIHGSIEINKMPNNEVRYLPNGATASLSMRTSSAVVTELAPLILILKHISYLRTLCYEEPEMSLHPQLQHEMGKLLVRLVNKGVNIIATTHSDIIMQHVNNMCKLHSLKSKNNLLKDNNLTDDDILDIKKVAVYQLTDKGAHSTVKRLKPQKNGFDLPTFSDALIKIFEQTSSIQDED